MDMNLISYETVVKDLEAHPLRTALRIVEG